MILRASFLKRFDGWVLFVMFVLSGALPFDCPCAPRHPLPAKLFLSLLSVYHALPVIVFTTSASPEMVYMTVEQHFKWRPISISTFLIFSLWRRINLNDARTECPTTNSIDVLFLCSIQYWFRQFKLILRILEILFLMTSKTLALE